MPGSLTRTTVWLPASGPKIPQGFAEPAWWSARRDQRLRHRVTQAADLHQLQAVDPTRRAHARGHHGAPEAQTRRLGQPAFELRHAAHLTAEPELTDRHRVARGDARQLRAGHREREREIEPALGDAQATRHAGVDVGTG